MYNLVGINGNAYNVMGYVITAMKECGFTKERQNEYQSNAMSGDYDNLLALSIEMIDKCNRIAGYNDNDDKE